LSTRGATRRPRCCERRESACAPAPQESLSLCLCLCHSLSQRGHAPAARANAARRIRAAAVINRLGRCLRSRSETAPGTKICPQPPRRRRPAPRQHKATALRAAATDSCGAARRRSSRGGGGGGGGGGDSERQTRAGRPLVMVWLHAGSGSSTSTTTARHCTVARTTAKCTEPPLRPALVNVAMSDVMHTAHRSGSAAGPPAAPPGARFDKFAAHRQSAGDRAFAQTATSRPSAALAPCRVQPSDPLARPCLRAHARKHCLQPSSLLCNRSDRRRPSHFAVLPTWPAHLFAVLLSPLLLSIAICPGGRNTAFPTRLMQGCRFPFCAGRPARHAMMSLLPRIK
jgi:hypothetical protein